VSRGRLPLRPTARYLAQHQDSKVRLSASCGCAGVLGCGWAGLRLSTFEIRQVMIKCRGALAQSLQQPQGQSDAGCSGGDGYAPAAGERAIAVQRTLHADASKAWQFSAPPLGGGRNAPRWMQMSSASDWWGRTLSTSGEREGRSDTELVLGRGRALAPSSTTRCGERRAPRRLLARIRRLDTRGRPSATPGRGVGAGKGEGLPFKAVVNQEIKAAQSLEVLLGLVVEQGGRFNFVNVSTG